MEVRWGFHIDWHNYNHEATLVVLQGKIVELVFVADKDTHLESTGEPMVIFVALLGVAVGTLELH